MTKCNAKYSSPLTLPAPENVGVDLLLLLEGKESCLFIIPTQSFNENIFALYHHSVFYTTKGKTLSQDWDFSAKHGLLSRPGKRAAGSPSCLIERV